MTSQNDFFTIVWKSGKQFFSKMSEKEEKIKISPKIHQNNHIILKLTKKIRKTFFTKMSKNQRKKFRFKQKFTKMFSQKCLKRKIEIKNCHRNSPKWPYIAQIYLKKWKFWQKPFFQKCLRIRKKVQKSPKNYKKIPQNDQIDPKNENFVWNLFFQKKVNKRGENERGENVTNHQKTSKITLNFQIDPKVKTLMKTIVWAHEEKHTACWY